MRPYFSFLDKRKVTKESQEIPNRSGEPPRFAQTAEFRKNADARNTKSLNVFRYSLEDTYKTIKSPAEGLFKDKGSKFFAFAYPIEQESEVKALIEPLRKEHFKAVHFCYAFRLGLDRTNFRVNDDGEPSGSAGRPILNVLLSKDITNILVVVVRYWGGTLLGVPGLINAYKSATEEALVEAEVIEKTINEVYQVQFEYIQMNDVMKVVKDFDLKIKNQQFDNQCTIEIDFRKSLANQILGKLEKIEGILVEYLRTV